MTEERIKAWHFANEDRTLGYGDGRKIVKGRTLSIDYPTPTWTGTVLCESGLHGSRRIIDALQYAPGPTITRVEIWGQTAEADDKLVGSHRKTLWWINGDAVLRAFARRCALDVIDRWDAPEIVSTYLLTGNPSLRGAAWAAARAAAWAARAARDARAAAWDAARAAAWAARDARDAAWDAAWGAQCETLEQMIREAKDGRKEWIFDA